LKFRVNKQSRSTPYQVPKAEFDIARKFAKEIYKEFNTFISVITVFGSTVTKKKSRDIDMLIVLDDVRMVLEPDVVQTYKIIVEKSIVDIDPRIHVQTMRLTSFWEYVRAGDPVAINILRSSIALVDTGFFDPLQALLDQGRIRPTREAVYTYFTMAPTGLFKARDQVLNGALDLYWAAINACHSALMILGEVPPSPSQVGAMMQEKMVKKGLLHKRHIKTIEDLYSLSKKITHREIKKISGLEFDKHTTRATDLVNTIQTFLEKKQHMRIKK